jgi:hypothetical protein
MEIFMRRSFVFAALALPVLFAAPVMAQTTTEPSPGAAPGVEAPAASPSQSMGSMEHKTQHHRRHHARTSSDDQAQATTHHRRGSKASSAEEEQTRQLNQAQLSGGGAPAQGMQGQGMQDQMAPSGQMPADQAAPAGAAPSTDGE